MNGKGSKEENYQKTVEETAAVCCTFLREMEDIQESLCLFDLKPAQERVAKKFGKVFKNLEKELSSLIPPANRTVFHECFSLGVVHLREACQAFTQTEGSSQLLPRILQSFHQLFQAQYAFYDLRKELNSFREHWLLEETLPMLEQLETPAIGNKQPTGFLHRPAERKRGEYSLYVPENYDASWEWPLIVCLHGGMGRGGDYIWTWLRPAKSKGYFLLSPKSLGPTWSLIGEDYDRESVLAMMGEVRSQYRIDNRKILLTGLSDGGSYGLTLGLNHPEHFSGLASIAGVLQTDADPQQVGNLSILIVHGRQDYIFPVGMARTAYAHLQQQGLRVTYQELPDWGHAFPYTIHARIVLPWFEEKIR